MAAFCAFCCLTLSIYYILFYLLYIYSNQAIYNTPVIFKQQWLSIIAMI